MSLVLSSTRPRARKSHRCENCGRTIGRGEVYRRAFLIADYGPYVWKECAHCEVFVSLYLDQFAPWADDEGYDHQSVVEWEPDTEAATEHRRQWVAQWRNDTGDLIPVPRVAADGP